MSYTVKIESSTNTETFKVAWPLLEHDIGTRTLKLELLLLDLKSYRHYTNITLVRAHPAGMELEMLQLVASGTGVLPEVIKITIDS